MREPLVIALDVGTSSARASLYGADGRLIEGRFHQVAYEPRTTPDGGAEHNPHVLLDAAVTCLDAVQRASRVAEIAAVGVTTFWHGLLGFDAAGAALTPLYLWADTRSDPDAETLRGALDEDALHARTGCHLHSSYWPAKLRWFARERPREMHRVARWGSFGEMLALRLFGDAVTSLSMASGTGLFDQAATRWDAEALAAAQLTPDRLFPLADRTEARRELRSRWSARWPFLRRAAWYPAIGDGAASSVGSDCIDPGRIALNVGTSAALRVVGAAPATLPRGLWRYRLDGGSPIVGGATSEGGNVYAWATSVLRLPDADRIEAALAGGEPGTHGLTALPFLAGERSPGWRGDRRAALVGLSLDTSAMDMLRALLEAVALRLALVHDLLAPFANREYAIVGSGGALVRSPAMLRMIADALGQPIRPSGEREATSRGAAVLALNAVGVLPDLGSVHAPLGDPQLPDPARHARYRAALERQRQLYERV